MRILQRHYGVDAQQSYAVLGEGGGREGAGDAEGKVLAPVLRDGEREELARLFVVADGKHLVPGRPVSAHKRGQGHHAPQGRVGGTLPQVPHGRGVGHGFAGAVEQFEVFGGAEFVAVKAEFGQEPCLVGVAGRVGEQSGAAYQHCLYRRLRVGVPADAPQRGGAGDALHGVGVRAEAHRAGQGDVGRGVPVAVGGLDKLHHIVGLALETLEGQRCQPVVHNYRGHIGDMSGAGQLGGRRLHEVAVFLLQRLVAAHCHLRNDRPVAAANLAVVVCHDVEDDAVVGRVAVVAVAVPVRGADVDLDIPRPQLAADAYAGVEEVGARAAVEPALVDNLHGKAVGCRQRQIGPKAVAPNILHQLFHTTGWGISWRRRPGDGRSTPTKLAKIKPLKKLIVFNMCGTRCQTD